MGDEDSSLSRIPRFSQIAEFSSEQISNASDQDRSVAYKVAQTVLKELNNPEHASANREPEYHALGRFIHNVESFAPKKEDQSVEAVAFRTTLAGLRSCQSGLYRKSSELYAFYTTPNAVEHAQIAERGAEGRLVIADKTGFLIDALILEQKLGNLPESDLLQVYRNLCAIGAEIMQTQDAAAFVAFQKHADRFAEAFDYPPISSVLKKEFLANQIQEQIAQLSLDSFHLRENVRKIKEDIARLKQLLAENSVSKTNLDRLDQVGRALDELVYPQLGKISEAEYEIIREMMNQGHADKSPQEREELIEKIMPRYANVEKTSMQSEKEEVLRRLKLAAQGTVRNLLNQAPSLLDGIRKTAIRDRFAALEGYLSIKPGFADKAFELILCIEHYGQFIDQDLRAMWAHRLGSQRFAALGEEPSQRQAFFDNYDYANPLTSIAEIKQRAIQERLQSIPFDAKAPAVFRDSCLTHETRHQELFTEETRGNAPEVWWLTDQAKNIRIPHSQGSDLLVNGGACFSNSLQRCSLALENPQAELKPGASALTRMRQTTYKLEPKARQKIEGLATPREIRTAQQYGLRISDAKRILFGSSIEAPPPNSVLAENHVQAAEQICQFAKQHATIALAMHPPSGLGQIAHAINIQIDSEHKIYRIIDDNVGLCEYQSEEELTEALTKMLATFYPEMVRFRVFAFQRS